LPERNFTVDMEALKNFISEKTKVIMLCSPSNPAGGVLYRRQLERINELAVKHDFYILCPMKPATK